MNFELCVCHRTINHRDPVCNPDLHHDLELEDFHASLGNVIIVTGKANGILKWAVVGFEVGEELACGLP